MKYLSTFEVAEKWGISPRRVGILCNNDRNRAHNGQEAAGLSRRTLKNRQMPALKAENISNRKLTERRKRNGRYLFTCGCPKKNH